MVIIMRKILLTWALLLAMLLSIAACANSTDSPPESVAAGESIPTNSDESEPEVESEQEPVEPESIIQSEPDAPQPESPPPIPPRPPTSEFVPATVRRVIDGDTIVLSSGERVRFIGIDAPEVGQPRADEATQFVKDRVMDTTIWLESSGADTDRFGRLRRYVWLYKPTDSSDEDQIRTKQLNRMLLDAGLATVMIVGDTSERPNMPPRPPTPDRPTRPGVSDTRIVGNQNSEVFHRPDCSRLPQPQNRIYFETRQEAEDSGRRPCSICRP